MNHLISVDADPDSTQVGKMGNYEVHHVEPIRKKQLE